jgi:hypothetical protein
MRGRETVKDIDSILTIALMAPPFNNDKDDSPTRIKAKKLCVIIKDALDQLIPGHVARYKAGYMPRAFGDAFQHWGVSTVLIESGLSNIDIPHHLVRLNFAALLTAFNSIATGSLEGANDKLYEDIPLEGEEQFDLLIRGALVYNGRNIPPYRSDIGINIDYELEKEQIIAKSIIEDLGDLSIMRGRKMIEAKDLIVIPGLIVRSENVEDEMFDQGVTTAINSTSENLRTAPVDGEILTRDIPAYTKNAAEFIKLKNIGLIDTDMKADLIIFSSKEEDKLSLKNLRYVIKNGTIVYKK